MLPRTPIEPEGTFAGLSGTAILLGAFVDVVFTEIVGVLLLLWLVPELPTLSETQRHEALAALAASTRHLALSIAFGTLGTVVGAFVGARRAGQLHVRHGGWIAVASTAIGVFLMLLGPPGRDAVQPPLWAQATAWLLILPAGMTGGALAAALPAANKRKR